MSSPNRPSAAASSVPYPRRKAAPAPPTPAEWPALVNDALRNPQRLHLVFQPIVSLAEAVIVGYEALARFDGPPGVGPDQWFAAADALGRGAELEAEVVRRCLDLRTSLPPNCFLTVNVSPHLLTEPLMSDLLLSAGDLSPLVLELTEHQAVKDLAPLVRLRDQLATEGALLALDDAGSGYSGLHQMAVLRPHLVKLDRALVADADRDELKLALAELLGEFSGRLDAWLLAEGIETWGELDAFLRLRVPLGQGYLLGRPAPPWAELAPEVAQRLRTNRARAELTEHIASLIETVPVHEADGHRPGGISVQVDERGRPSALVLPDPHGRHPAAYRIAPVSLRVAPSADVIEVAQRLVGRPEHCRFDPVVCIDPEGRAMGIVRLERILLRLAELKALASTPQAFPSVPAVP